MRGAMYLFPSFVSIQKGRLAEYYYYYNTESKRWHMACDAVRLLYFIACVKIREFFYAPRSDKDSLSLRARVGHMGWW